MTLHGFQSALAYVIRFHDESKRKTLQEIFSAYPLTHDEQNVLKSVVLQQRLKAYSEEMFIARWRIIESALGFMHQFVDRDKLKALWEHDFEPKHLCVTYEDIVLKFVDYLVTDPNAHKFITTDVPDYFPDVMRYIHCVFTFNHNWLPPSPPKPTGSLLTDRYFRVLDLQYDVREICVSFLQPHEHQINDCDTSCAHETAVVVKKQPLTLLFVASDAVTEFRSFEIDHELRNFLLAELTFSGERKGLVPCYQDLVEIGLLKPLH